MSNSGSFHLSLILSAINRTGSAFGAIYRSEARLQERRQQYQQAQNDLLSIGTGVSVGMAGYILKSGMELENIKTRFEVFLKDGNKAKQMLLDLNKFADITPFSNQETYKAAGFLLPYIKDSKVLTEELSMLGDVAKGINAPFGELVEKYARFKAQGKLHMQDIYELTGRGFDVNLIKKAVGVDNLEDASRSGKLTFEKIREAMKLATEQGGMFENMMERMSKTGSGKLSTAMGTAQYSLSNMSEKLMPTMVQLLDEVIPLVNAFSQWVEANPKLAKGLIEVTVGLAGLSVGRKVLTFLYTGAALNISRFMSMAVSVHRVSQAYRALAAAQAAGNMTAWYTALQNYGAAGNTAARMLGMARIQQLVFNAAVLTNPYVLAIAGLVALAGVIYVANERMTDLNESQQMLLDIATEAKDKVVDEHVAFTKLWKELEKTNPKSKEFADIKAKLLSQYPQYLNKVDLEKAKVGDLPSLYKRATEAMLLHASQRVAIERGEKAQKEWSQAMFDKEDAKRRLNLTGGNVGDRISKSMGQTPIGMIAREFSMSKDVTDADARQRQAEADMKTAELIATKLAEKMKDVNITVNTETKLDGKTIAKSTNNVNEVNNRGSIE